MPHLYETSSATRQRSRGKGWRIRQNSKRPPPYPQARSVEILRKFRVRIPRLIDLMSIALILVAAYIYLAVLADYPA